MRRMLVVLSLLVATSAFAQQFTARFVPPLVRVDPGAAVQVESILSYVNQTSVSNLSVRYDLDGGATFTSISGFGGNCAISGNTAECSMTPQPGSFETRVVLGILTGNGNGTHATVRVSATATRIEDAGTVTTSATGALQNYRLVIVTTTADSGVGSLRAAIDEANGIGKPAKLLFQIAQPVPAEGWFTIVPASPLPPITVDSMFVDGKSQTRFTGDTNTRGPEIAIDGHLAHRGLEIHSRCEAKIEGLTLGHFDANQGLWFTKDGACASLPFTINDERWVTDNYIGIDPTGTIAWPNLRGLRADFGVGDVRNNVISGNTYSGMWVWITADRPNSLNIEDNKFGTAADGVTPLPNGAAGILFGPRVSADVRRNVIANHPGMGIALDRNGTTYVEIRQNSMRDNGGIGIDWGVDGVSPRVLDDADTVPNAPVLLSARYDSATDRTYFSVVVDSGRPNGPNGYDLGLDFYANRGPDGDGEQWLGIDHGPGTLGTDAFEAWLPG
ncbi:MAG TPA: right-handed parallel beta-helix repeat-containing protein, partial [Thermoanaerobaculia bacterium]